jgi:hypothetical protein
VWKRSVGQLTLTFRLAGINNQNFLMRDEQTGTFWQQISGLAISGPLAGRQLELIPSDELTFGLWRAEQPAGTLLAESPRDAARYAARDWEAKMQNTPTVLSYAEPGLQPRTLVLGIQAGGAARAYPHELILRETLVLDRLGAVPLAIVLGPDNRSIRAFRAQLPASGAPTDFYRLTGEPGALLVDEATGSRWNFQGCAIAGPAAGACLERLELIRDYWFDWRHYHPDTSVFRRPR